MVLTDREDLAEKIRLQRSHGMTTLTYDRHKGHAYSYDVVDLGYNYRIDEIRSALGLEQLKKLERNNNLRERWTRLYWEILGDTGVGLPFRVTEGQPAYHIFPILLPDGVERKGVIDRMRQDGIQTSIHYPPTHTFSYYKARYGEISLPKTEKIGTHELTLPLYPTMGEEGAQLVTKALKAALKLPQM